MSTQYKIVVHCDEVRSSRCHDLLETAQADVQTDPGEMLHRVMATLSEAGWQRSIPNERRSYDVCPECWPAVEAELAHQQEGGSER